MGVPAVDPFRQGAGRLVDALVKLDDTVSA
jgi:hypothetical protein